jgi:hypothetical protein
MDVKRTASEALACDWLIPWSRIIFQKPTASELVKEFPAVCDVRRFIAAFTTACHFL